MKGLSSQGFQLKEEHFCCFKDAAALEILNEVMLFSAVEYHLQQCSVNGFCQVRCEIKLLQIYNNFDICVYFHVTWTLKYFSLFRNFFSLISYG